MADFELHTEKKVERILYLLFLWFYVRIFEYILINIVAITLYSPIIFNFQPM